MDLWQEEDLHKLINNNKTHKQIIDINLLVNNLRIMPIKIIITTEIMRLMTMKMHKQIVQVNKEEITGLSKDRA